MGGVPEAAKGLRGFVAVFDIVAASSHTLVGTIADRTCLYTGLKALGRAPPVTGSHGEAPVTLRAIPIIEGGREARCPKGLVASMKVHGAVPACIVGSYMLNKVSAAPLGTVGDAAISTASDTLNVCLKWINVIK